ncbi:hypothetical protein [Gemmata sp. SH-PL17]|uniref:hypothetical protein n=1 Tax=Gemmata sp. SH-PL17 TaxID=1630693 RepID=UPI001EF751F6|nr:hypothetical protein [Gemmata sp. SH-PL17]
MISAVAHLDMELGTNGSTDPMSGNLDSTDLRHRCRCRLSSHVRDMFGNPFRSTGIKRHWRTSTALTLASQMYESRDFSAMPILADALQDAGCDSTDVLSHCRGDGPHVRGCWVVDLVLRKE